jgi:hypothetical protein
VSVRAAVIEAVVVFVVVLLFPFSFGGEEEKKDKILGEMFLPGGETEVGVVLLGEVLRPGEEIGMGVWEEYVCGIGTGSGRGTEAAGIET